MKHVIVFGATGRVGHQIVNHALDNEMHVTAFVRRTDYFNDVHPNLRLIQGDVTNAEDVRKALIGIDIVFSALGDRNFTAPEHIVSRGIKNIVEAMELNGVNRLLTVSGNGILQYDEDSLIREQEGFPDFLMNVSEDHLKTWYMLEDSSVDWTMVCAPQIMVVEHSGSYIVMEDYFPEGSDKVSSGDIADFMVNESLRNFFIRKRVGINSTVS